jgi:hypothetical protein
MAFALITGFLVAVVLAQSAWIVKQQRDLGNQDSKHAIELATANARYDDLVESIKARANVQPITRGDRGPVRRQARNFSEFRDADERGVLPRGMRKNGT